MDDIDLSMVNIAVLRRVDDIDLSMVNIACFETSG